MEQPIHTLNCLFDQLGLPSNDDTSLDLLNDISPWVMTSISIKCLSLINHKGHSCRKQLKMMPIRPK